MLNTTKATRPAAPSPKNPTMNHFGGGAAGLESSSFVWSVGEFVIVVFHAPADRLFPWNGDALPCSRLKSVVKREIIGSRPVENISTCRLYGMKAR